MFNESSTVFVLGPPLIKTGQVVDETFRGGQKIETVRIEAKDYNYIYNDGDSYFFMDSETYEQISLEKSVIDTNILDFLIENTAVTITFDPDNNPVEIRLPSHMNIKVHQEVHQDFFYHLKIVLSGYPFDDYVQ